MPRLLAIFDQYNVPATWATVGHLFLEHCECQGGAKHPEVARAPYYRSEHWSYETGDWFDADPCSDYQRDPAWYAPDLLRDIVAARVGHEIACHTFSHIDSSDEHCPAEVMDTELAACSRAAAAWGITLKSFVFPGNHPGNYASLKRHGFLAYRRHGHYHLDWPQQDALGLWQVPGGLRWETPPRWSPRDWQTVLCHAVDQALATGTMLHLWFHPSCDPVNLECVFPMLLAYVNARRDRLWVGTMEQLVKHMATAAPAERQNPWGR
jgi:peptidoglycan/xylan/chitin deacetylase (PgdA/CDA1 family)